MRKNNKLYIIIAVLASIFLFTTAALFDQCSILTGLKASEEPEEEVSQEKEADEEEDAEEDKEKTGEETGEEEASKEEEKTEPTISLEIYQDATPIDGICYYRVQANVTGNPAPEINWNRDDSGGAWGEMKAQVNLYEASETFTIVATATNSEGSDEASIDLSWRCNSQNTVGGKTNSYSEEELEYFLEIALGCEYGASQPIIHKWTNNIKIKINGTPTSEDLDSLNQVITELNSLISGVSLDIVTNDQNIDIYFTIVDQFASIIPSYVPGNMGFFMAWWDSNEAIYRAKILIAIDGVNQQERSHLIREELTQSLGIMKDSYRYKDSIFYQGWTDTINYSPIDCTIISLLYNSRLRSGMTQEQVMSALVTH